MIDFAKTYPLPDGLVITHNDEWKVGNHEDGYLIGVDSLIRIFESISIQYSCEASSVEMEQDGQVEATATVTK